MSTSNVHQQSLANAGSETRPPMLERDSYIPCASCFRRYLYQKRETRKWLNKEIDEGPYEFTIFTSSETKAPMLQKEEDLRGDDLKNYEAEIEAMNLILIFILNDIYKSMDACTTIKSMWKCKLVNASREKKLEKSHDPLALVAHTGSSSRTSSPYYVTHPSSMVHYDDDYQGVIVQNNSDDPLTFVMILLARAITQNLSNPTNNRLRTSSNTRNQAIIQGDRDEAGVILTDEQNDFLFTDASRMEEIKVLRANICLMAKIQLANIDYDAGPSYDSVFLSEAQTPSTGYMNSLSTKDYQVQKYPTQPKIINKSIDDIQIDSNIIFHEPNEDVNSGSVDNDNNDQDSYVLEQLARNAYKEAEKQHMIVKKVQ
uniref:Retrovirus-related Pol polyprotein from transposon TNT 1-94 n=1 Tax=Tanacetum cinerariifolium TaxID=118510 RepID=A0A6L2MHM1_TANCI|nr:hypothetical protein [Tanacetum cinerariifolium]